MKFRVLFSVVALMGSLTPVLQAGCECAENQPLAVIPQPRLVSHSWMSLARWYEMHAEDVAEAEKGEGQIVLVGDSITEGWQWGDGKYWNEVLKPMGAVNQGIGGDMTQNVLWRLNHGDVMELKPERVICLIGTNNFGHTQETPEQVSKGCIAVVKKLTEVFPEADVLTFAVFPRGEKADNPDREKIATLNRLVKPVGDWDRVTFLDIGERFLQEDGSISSEIMPDFLHPSPKGYKIWLDAIMEWIEFDATKSN